jgi:hypothetical protein
MNIYLAAALLLAAGSWTPAAAQSVKHIQTDGPGGIASGVVADRSGGPGPVRRLVQSAMVAHGRCGWESVGCQVPASSATTGAKASYSSAPTTM